jgi:hypothetical protein
MSMNMLASSVGQISGIQTPYAIGSMIKIATKFATNDAVQIWNDGTVQTDTSCLLVPPTTLRIPTSDAVFRPASMLIEKLYFGAPTISNADAAAHRSAME